MKQQPITASEMPRNMLKCPQGHPYEQSDFAQGSYKAGWVCSRCKTNHGPLDKRHFCRLCKCDLCFNCEPPPDDDDMMPTFLNPVTKRHEPLLRLNRRLSCWIGPRFVEDIIALRFDYISDRHKTLIQHGVQWTIPALKWCYRNVEIKRKCRRLLGTFQFTQCLSWAQPSWPTLMNGLAKEMGFIGDKLDRLYHELGLRDVLGTFVPRMLPGTNHRQDCPGGLVLPSFFRNSEEKEAKNPFWRFEPVTIGNEIAYIHFLRLIGTAIINNYRCHIQDVIGDLLAKGKFHAYAIKGYERLQNKLKSFDDHWTEPVPRPAESVDVVRGIAEFDDPHKMRDAMERLQDSFGSFVKFKNGMAWSDEQAKASMHLRLILACVRFTPKHPDTNAPLTFGDLCNDQDVQKKWAAYASRDPPASRCIDEGVVGSGPWHRSIATAMKWLHSDEMRNEVVTMVCEVQMLLEEYSEERNKMHEMYKVFRADNAIRLHADFVSSQKQELAQEERNKDQGMVNRNGVWERDTSIFSRMKRAIFEERLHFSTPSSPLKCDAGHDMVQCAAKPPAEGEQDPKKLMWSCSRCSTTTLFASAPRHTCTTCSIHICNTCEPFVPNDDASASFDDQLRQLMPTLQGLMKTQIAALVSIACIYGKKNVVEVLLSMIQQFESPSAVTTILACSGSGYHFPLFNAAVCKKSAHRLDIMKLLINAKADPKQKTGGGCSPLWKAANSGFIDSVRFLLESKAEVNAMQDSTTITPLYNACYRGHDEIAALLIEHKGSVNQVRKTTGATALYTACENAHAPIVVTLIAHKANVNQCTTKNNSSPMYIASQNGHLEIIHILAAAKANPHLGRSSDGCTPLYAASDKGYGAIVEYLHGVIQSNPDWKCRCEGECCCGINVLVQNRNWCPLNIAAYRGFLPCVRKLVELGASQRSIRMAIQRTGANGSAIREFLQSHVAEDNP